MAAVVVALIGGSDGLYQGIYRGTGDWTKYQCNSVGIGQVGDVDVCMAEITPACMAFTPTPGVLTDTSTEGQGGIGSAMFHQQGTTPDAGGGGEGVVYPVGDWRILICSYPWPCEEALAVVYGTSNCPDGESGGDPWAYNNGCYGLFQVSCVSHRSRFEGECEVLYDPQVNVRVAYDIYVDNGGWSPWTCRP
jgi:hypothetical protein